MTDEQLLSETQVAIDDEKNATARVVRLFAEIQTRKLYLRLGYPSLHEMATKKYGYSSSCAGVRIAAMKLIMKCPEVEQKIESGEICLTVAASIQSFTYREKTVDVAELVDFCIGKSTREIEREFARISPEFEKREHVRQTTADRVRVSYGSSNRLEEKLERIRMAWSHKNHNPTREELLEMMADDILKDLDPNPPRAAKRASAQNSPRSANQKDGPTQQATPTQRGHAEAEFVEDLLPTPGVRPEFVVKEAAELKTRYIPRKVKSTVLKRNAGEGCEFVSADGRRCGNQYQLQFDHIKTFAHGGAHTPENLRLYCAQHNRARNDLERSFARMHDAPSRTN